jgi:hypothetical protein
MTLQNEIIVTPSGALVDSGISPEEYQRRVLEIVALYDCDYSDAQGIFDCQLLEVRK